MGAHTYAPHNRRSGARATPAAGLGNGTLSSSGRPQLPQINAAAALYPGPGAGEMLDRRGYNPNPRDLAATPAEAGNQTVIKNVRPRNGRNGR